MNGDSEPHPWRNINAFMIPPQCYFRMMIHWKILTQKIVHKVTIIQHDHKLNFHANTTLRVALKVYISIYKTIIKRLLNNSDKNTRTLC